MFGLVDLGTVFGLANPQYLWAMSLEASWGSLLTFFVAAGFGWVAALPSRPWPGFGLLVIAAASLVIAGVVFGDPGPLWLGGGVAVATGLVWVVLQPGRPSRGSGRPAALARVVAVLGVPLWLGYAWNTSLAAGAAGVDQGDVTNGIDHWPVQVALGLAVAAGSAVLAGLPSPLPLWRCAFALSAGFVAYATIVFPDRAGAMPHLLWGVGIAVWGAAVALAPRARS